MKIVLKHIIRNIVEKKLRSSIVLLTILLSTFVLFIGLSLNAIINETYQTMLQGAYGSSNIVITKSASEESSFYGPSDLVIDHIGEVQQLNIIQGSGKVRIEGKEISSSLYGLEATAARDFELIDIIAGETSDDLQSVVISQRTATQYDLQLGDVIKLEHGEDTYELTISAISKLTGIFYTEMDTVLLLAHPEKVNELYGLEGMVTSTYLEVDAENIDSTLSTLKENNDRFTIQKSSAADTILRDEQTFQTVMLLAIIIIVLISAYVISSLSKLILSERMPVLGTFRSVGAQKGTMNRILLLEFFVYGFIGSILGIIFALLALPYAADIFNEYKAYGVETVVHYNFIYAGIAVVFGMAFPVFISLIRIVKTNRKPLKEVLFETANIVEARSKWTILTGIILLVLAFGLYFFNTYDDLVLAIISLLSLFVSIVMLMPLLLNGLATVLRHIFQHSTNGELKLGMKNIANNRIVSNNVSMIIVVFLLLIMVGVSSNGIDHYVSNTLTKDFDVSVSISENNQNIEEGISSMEGISETSVQTISLGSSSVKGKENSFAVYGFANFYDVDEFYDGITYLELDEDNISTLENAVILDEYYMDKYGIEIGDVVFVQPVDIHEEAREQIESVELIVSGKMNSAGFNSSRDSVFIPIEIFEEHFATIFRQLDLRLVKGEMAEEMKATIQDNYAPYSLEVVTFDEMLGSQKATIDTLIDGITIIIGLGMIVGILGISNNLIVSFNQRKKEYAVLYSVCMSKGQIIKMVFAEMLITFIAVVIIGLFGGYALTILLTKLLHAIGLVSEFTFTFGLFGLLCFVVGVLLCLSTLTLIRKVFKLNIMKELRYE
ncbi:ABC transporter permease [Ornithinibacillus halotolerans]|uniref:ABC transporter permease n=1 Tax=Ornithinibacillus halotolerans TaxID=1274357 RepID=A0A916W415_9BACI|nr:FtsX-like permease family protein [Ornithinibacillus halotolerans]GGA65643.1 ABC transporter permease [Ornithinibacillus halotolerans]